MMCFLFILSKSDLFQHARILNLFILTENHIFSTGLGFFRKNFVTRKQAGREVGVSVVWMLWIQLK